MLILEEALFFYFLASVCYTVLLSIAGHFYKGNLFPQGSVTRRIGVLLPCYKEDNIILSVVQKLIQMDYPRQAFDIVIIADSFQAETLMALAGLPVVVIEVRFEKSLKSKSLNHAMQLLNGKYDTILVLDADNITKPDFLHSINNALEGGAAVIQAQRVAKNTDTPFAIFDACSEAVNNHLYRKGANALGFSASLIGSGMAMPCALFRDSLIGIESVLEDRELQLALARSRHKIVYLENALVYDEKVDNSESFRNQRSRWFYAQLKSLKDNFVPGFAELLKGNFDYFNFAVLYNIFPPRVFSIAFLFILTLIFSTLFVHYPFIFLKWTVMTLAYFVALALALPRKYYSGRTVRAMIHLPKALVKSFQALLEVRTARKGFIHTPHKQTEIDNHFIGTHDR